MFIKLPKCTASSDCNYSSLSIHCVPPPISEHLLTCYLLSFLTKSNRGDCLWLAGDTFAPHGDCRLKGWYSVNIRKYKGPSTPLSLVETLAEEEPAEPEAPAELTVPFSYVSNWVQFTHLHNDTVSLRETFGGAVGATGRNAHQKLQILPFQQYGQFSETSLTPSSLGLFTPHRVAITQTLSHPGDLYQTNSL